MGKGEHPILVRKLNKRGKKRQRLKKGPAHGGKTKLRHIFIYSAAAIVDADAFNFHPYLDQSLN